MGFFTIAVMQFLWTINKKASIIDDIFNVIFNYK